VKVFSQQPVPVVTMQLRQVPVLDILLEMEKQTGVLFSYESSLLNDLPLATLIAEEESLAYCLKKLFAPLPVVYRLTGKYVVLKRKPKQYTISGFVRDSISFESLINATVVEVGSGRGVTSNNYGFYSITLTAGEYLLRGSYVGFEAVEHPLILEKDTMIDLQLHPLSSLQEVVIEGRQEYSELLSSRTGGVHLSAHTLQQVPAVMGESDLIKVLQQIPGVATGTEILTGMYVRGGNGDENLFLLDGNPVYHVNHLGGVFSTFNPDAVKNVEFYKGSFPARYGGRLSSVIDVRMNEGNMQEYHGNLSIGLLAAKANLEGPIIKDKTSFNVSFRRTWLDALTTPALLINRKVTKNDYFLGYSFYDLNAKVNHVINPRHRLYLNVYAGQDRFRYRMDENVEVLREETSWRWGNFLSSLKWNWVITNKLFANLTVNYTRYKSKMREEDQALSDEQEREVVGRVYRFNGSGIEDIGYRLDLDYMPLPEHRIRFGSDYLYHVYYPEKKRTKWGEYEQGEWVEKDLTTAESRVYGHEWALYAEDDWSVNERLTINAGARLAVYHVGEKDYFSFQPRLSFRYLLREDLSVKGAFAKMNQYVHQLSNTYVNLPTDIWVPVTERVAPMYSNQFSAGLYYNWNKQYDFSLEGFYKQMNNLIEYQDNASLFPDYVGWDEKVALGSGRSYGIELMARKSYGRTTGWMCYTLSWSDRIFKDGQVNNGERFPARYDNRHKFSFTMVHKLNDKMDISATWMFATGNRATIQVDNYFSPDKSILEQWDEFYTTHWEPVYKRNAAKLGNYHRLDVSFNFYQPKKKGRMGIWNVSVYNAYCRMNPFYIDGVVSMNQYGKFVVNQRGFIPIIPSVSYTYKF